jgi:hypothetical protein
MQLILARIQIALQLTLMTLAVRTRRRIPTMWVMEMLCRKAVVPAVRTRSRMIVSEQVGDSRKGAGVDSESARKDAMVLRGEWSTSMSRRLYLGFAVGGSQN